MWYSGSAAMLLMRPASPARQRRAEPAFCLQRGGDDVALRRHHMDSQVVPPMYCRRPAAYRA